MRNLFFLGLIFTATSLWAQNDERPESNLDLRGAKPLLLIETHGGKERIELERSQSGDYYLSAKSKDGSQKNKISRPKAEGLDQRFSALFLKLQYEMPEDEKGCKQHWKLVLRGEELLVCNKNEQKNQEINPLFSELKKDSTP